MADYRPQVIDPAIGRPVALGNSDRLDLPALYVDAGNIELNGGDITGLPSIPTGDTSPISKAFFEAAIDGLTIKPGVRVKTAAALPAYTAAGSGEGKTLTADANGALTVDGVAVADDDTVLHAFEGTSHVDHGIYDVTEAGDAGTPWQLTRRDDFDEDSEVFGGASVWVNEGTAHYDQRWTVSTNNDITVDTTAIQFTQTGGQGDYTGGDGIDITDGVIKVDLVASDPGLEISGNKLQALVDGTTISKATSLNVLGLPSLFTIDGTAVGASVTAGNLDDLVDGSNADSLHTHATADADLVKEVYTAGENLAIGDPVEIDPAADDQVRKCDAATAAKISCIGVALAAATATNPVTVIKLGKAAVLSGATRGTNYFVGSGGGLIAGIGSLSAGEHIMHIGEARTATLLEVKPEYAGGR